MSLSGLFQCCLSKKCILRDSFKFSTTWSSRSSTILEVSPNLHEVLRVAQPAERQVVQCFSYPFVHIPPGKADRAIKQKISVREHQSSRGVGREGGIKGEREKERMRMLVAILSL